MTTTDSRALLAYCEAHQAWLLDTVAQLVRLESPSTDKAAVDRCGAVLAGMLTSMGGSVERLPQTERGDHIRAEWGGGDRQILLLGSDGNFTGALGVPTLDGLGPMGDGAHAAHEHVVVSDLAWRAAFLSFINFPALTSGQSLLDFPAVTSSQDLW